MWLSLYDKIVLGGHLKIKIFLRELRCFLFGHEYVSIDREGCITVCMYCGKDYEKNDK